MPGNREVAALQARLDATFDRVGEVPEDNLELRSDYARYLCILVSGFIETAVSAIAAAYCRERAHATVANYASGQLGRLQNLNSERLEQAVGAFDAMWRDELTRFLDGPRKDAVDSVRSLRNRIAHGDPVDLTYVRIRDYYARIKEVIAFMEGRFS